MWNVVLLLMGMLSPYSGGAGLEPVSAAGMTAPAVHASWSVHSPAGQENVFEDFETLNEIALTDRTEDVLRKKGEPLKVTHEPLLRTTEYHYADMTVGLCDGLTEYVHVKPSAKSIQVNGQSVLLTTRELSSALGKPYHEGEDGDVYLRNHQAIKVFKDRGTGDISGVDLFFEE